MKYLLYIDFVCITIRLEKISTIKKTSTPLQVIRIEILEGGKAILIVNINQIYMTLGFQSLVIVCIKYALQSIDLSTYNT